jgi:hypothetical protein
LGKVSPIGCLFTLGSIFFITVVAQIFFPGKGDALISTKNGLGNALGDFFPNSSGHPASEKMSIVVVT